MRISKNGNIVPWQIVAEQKNAKIKAAHVDPNSEFNSDIIRDLVTDKTKIIAFPHVSNVLLLLFMFLPLRPLSTMNTIATFSIINITTINRIIFIFVLASI